ncbi:MAG: polysaccharide deacetylase family protein [Specibacter sp.]
MHTTSGTGRLVILAALAVVLAAVAFGVVRLTSGSTSATGASSPAPLTTAAVAPASPSKAPASSAPATSAPPVNPKTGRVDTLGGLVPDYVLPPIENGMVPVVTKIPTEQKVVFLTIDDGAVKRESDLKLLESHGVKASLFLAHTFIAGHSSFYKAYTDAGYLIEDHTMTHNLNFINLSYAQQKAEICGMADFEEKQFGRRPVFFRPPGGPYTQAIRQAAAECGMKAIVDWEAKANAGGMDYQVGSALRPGEIVLMHFRPEFPADLAAFLKAQKAAGLKVVLLEDYLGVK